MNRPRHLRWQSNGWAGLILVLLLALTFVWFTFGGAFIQGHSSYWQSDAEDITQYIAGFNMYFSAPWQHPLLAFDSLNYPAGTRATFVDIIPLYALLLKILMPANWAPFNPFGAWVALCFVLQAVGAWWIARELRANAWGFLLSLAVLMLMTPALLSRIGHISLMSHWLLVFAIALYLRGWRQRRLPAVAWVALLLSAFYINIYLFVMAAGLYAAAAVSTSSSAHNRARYWLQATAPVWAVAASLPLMLWPLPLGGVTQEWGFGYYSMNLLSPFIGGYIIRLQAEVGAGQYEGFNYLGLGLIIAIGLVCLNGMSRRRVRQAIGQHRALVGLLALYVVYALSNQIYLGGTQVATVTYPGITQALTSQFRVSGRFFWPVTYVLMVGTWWFLYRHHGARKFLYVATALVVLQTIDLTQVHANLKSTLARPAATHLQPAAWDAAIPAHINRLYFYPKFKCGQAPAHSSLLPVMHYASMRGLKLNTGYIARYTPQCDDMNSEIAASPAQESAYVFVRQEFAGLDTVRAILPNPATVCHEVDFAFICAAPR